MWTFGPVSRLRRRITELEAENRRLRDAIHMYDSTDATSAIQELGMVTIQRDMLADIVKRNGWGRGRPQPTEAERRFQNLLKE